jgi:recombination protein RecA
MSQALRKLTGVASRTQTCIMFINQLRMKIGVTFGSPETTTGGNALKFYASVRLEITRTGTIKKGEESVGNQTRVKVVKNKLAPPFREVDFEIYFGQGVSREAELIDLGVASGIVRKSGAWYAMGDERLGQGKEAARELLAGRADLCDTIRQHVLKHFGVIDGKPTAALPSVKSVPTLEA